MWEKNSLSLRRLALREEHSRFNTKGQLGHLERTLVSVLLSLRRQETIALDYNGVSSILFDYIGSIGSKIELTAK